jgi:uncharacterized protein (TIGR02145 family)
MYWHVVSGATSGNFNTYNSNALYSVRCRRLSSDATLSGITLSAGLLAPSPFHPDSTAYRVNVPGDCVSNISVTGIKNHSAAMVAGNVTNTSLLVGNTVVTLVVTAENGAQKNYTVTVVRSSISGSKVTDDAGNCYRTKVYDGVEWMIDNAQKTGITGCDYAPLDRTTQTLNYGCLYSWNCAALACPTGWSLPTDDNFTALKDALNAAADWADWNSGSSLAGHGIDGSYLTGQDSYGSWWSNSSTNYRRWHVAIGATGGNFYTSSSSGEFSLRCRKN